MATAVTTILQSAFRQTHLHSPLHLPLQTRQGAASASAEAHRTGAFVVRYDKPEDALSRCDGEFSLVL